MLRRLSPPPADAGMVRRYNPTNASTTPTDVQRLRLRFQNKARSIGTSTTETPVKESRFRWRRIFQAYSLQFVPDKEEEAHQQSGAQRTGGETSKLAIENHRQHDRRQAHADRVEKQRRNIRERVLDDDEIRAPDQSDQNQKNVGFEGAGHAPRVADEPGRTAWGQPPSAVQSPAVFVRTKRQFSRKTTAQLG